jgi:hypothetical protein
VLTISAVVLVLSAAGSVVVVKVAHLAMNRLGLELWSVLFWFGLADAPVSEMVVRNFAAPRHRGDAAATRPLSLPESL